MTNELLEQWRKEAIEYAEDNGYITGTLLTYEIACKATHEKMLKMVERLKGLINEAFNEGYIEHSYSHTLPFGQKMQSKRDALSTFLKDNNL